MHHGENVIGRNVAKFRYQRGWTQDVLVAKLQLLGCYMTRDILASIETQRCVATDKQIEFFAEIYHIREGDLFPAKRHLNGQLTGLVREILTRRKLSKTPPLAQPAQK